MELPQEGTDENHREVLEERRNQFLAQIPLNLLLTDAAKKIREKIERENGVQENRPLVSYSSWVEPYTEEKWLKKRTLTRTRQKIRKLQYFFEFLINSTQIG